MVTCRSQTYVIITLLFALNLFARDTLRVITYNIWQWNMGVSSLQETISQSSANIVGLQEAWNERDNNRIAENLGWNVVFGGKEGNAKPDGGFDINGYHMPQVLLTQYGILEHKYYNIADDRNDRPDEELNIARGATLGKLLVPPADTVYALVLHLNPWDDAWCVDEITGLLGKLDSLSDYPIIVMGDFNTRSHLDGYSGDQAQVHKLMEKNGFIDSYHQVTQHQRGRIDFIFGNGFLEPIESLFMEPGIFGVEDGDSDHLGVYSEFIFTGNEVRGCTDPDANNYNPDATIDDGSCEYTGIPDNGAGSPFSISVRPLGGDGLSVEFAKRGKTGFEILDVKGRRLGTHVTDPNGKGIISTGGISKGICFLKVAGPGGQRVKKIILY